jgi:hypothetical protein
MDYIVNEHESAALCDVRAGLRALRGFDGALADRWQQTPTVAWADFISSLPPRTLRELMGTFGRQLPLPLCSPCARCFESRRPAGRSCSRSRRLSTRIS